MEAYKYFVRTNREFVQNLESLANAITWLLPERFSNSEIGPEAVYAILGTVSAVNQHIVDTTPPKPGVNQSKLATSAFPWSLLVSILKDGEAVVEVASQHFFGQDGKWSFLAAMEGLKALVRLAAFHESGYKMLLQGGEVLNEGKGLDEKFQKNEGPSHNFPDNSLLSKNLEGRAMAALNKFGESSMKRGAPNKPGPQLTLSTILHERGTSGRLFLLGEVIHVLRPLLYVLFIRKFGIKSWAPWLVSLSVDLIGMTLISRATGTGRRYQLTENEKEELRRRKNILALYIIRDPFFTKHTRKRLEKVDEILSPVPIVSFFTSKFIELLIGIQTRYTYTSGS